GRAQQERGPGGRFLDGFEQGVGGGLGEPVGVFDDEDLPAPRGGGPSSLQDQGADLVDAEGEPFGDDAGDVGVGAAEDGAAGVALAAPSGVALEGGGEGHGGGGTAGAGRSGEEPRVGHAEAAGGVGEEAPRPGLADELVEDAARLAGGVLDAHGLPASSATPVLQGAVSGPSFSRPGQRVSVREASVRMSRCP